MMRRDADSARRGRASESALWASAFVLGGMVLMAAGNTGGGSAIAASGVAADDDFTLIVARNGRGPSDDPEEMIYLIDNRDELLLIYEIEDARREEIVFRNGGSLAGLFSAARR